MATRSIGKCIILLVEDDASVRRVTRRMLEGGGYEVVDVGDAATALAVANHPEATIHAVVSDAVMPGMTGAAMLEAIRARHPGCPALLISGYSDDEMTRRGIRQGAFPFLPKPYTTTDLLEKLDRLLDR